MAKKRTDATPKATREQRFELRLSAEEKALFQDAASRQGIGMAQWLRLAGRMVIRTHGGKVEL